jgi:hypothetical protein
MENEFFQPDKTYEYGWYAAETIKPDNKRELERIREIAKGVRFLTTKYKEFVRFTMALRGLGAYLPGGHELFEIETNPWGRSAFAHGFLDGLKHMENLGKFKQIKKLKR